MKKFSRQELLVFLGIIVAGAIIQFLIFPILATNNGEYHLDYPVRDQYFYAGIARNILAGVPPENPYFSGSHYTPFWLQLSIVSFFQLFLNVYLAMKLITVFWLIIFLLFLRKYRPADWPLIAILVLFSSPLIWLYQPIAYSLIERGFAYFPAIIAMLILFFERKKKWFIIPAAILLPFFHFALAAIFILGLVITYIQNREKYRLLPLILLALSSLSVVFINSFDRYYGGFWPDLKLLIDFIDPFLHLFPLIIIILLARKSLRNYLPFIIASFLVFVFINRFSFYAIVIFDIFVVLAAVDSFTAEKSFDRFKKGVVVLSLLAFFVQFLFLILPGNPFYRGDVVWDQTLYQRPLDWIKANTDPKSVFAIWPLGQERSNLLFAVRNVYIGAGGGDVGLVPDERVEQVMKIYKNISIPEEVDYVFYGPVEHLNFPDFSPKINAVYDDGIIKIYAAK